MSKYTTEVRFLCESLTGHDESEDYSSIDEIIEDALPIIFSFEFPIFDEQYRSVLETKILRHYYTREIGCETYGLWKLRLQTKLNEIMPYYNKLYESELLKYNPLYDVDMTTTNVGQRTGERTDLNNAETTENRNRANQSKESWTSVDERKNSFDGTRESENAETNVNSSQSIGTRDTENRDMYSDTPQGQLTGVDTNTYLTNFRKILGDDDTTETGHSTGVTNGTQKIKDGNTETTQGSNVSSNKREESTTDTGSQSSSSSAIGKSKNTEDYVMHVFGKSAGANYAKMIKDFRDNLLNIDMDIIRDLADLFMLIW